MKCVECGVEISDGLYCVTHAGKPDKSNYMSPTMSASRPEYASRSGSMSSRRSTSSRKSSGSLWALLAVLVVLLLVWFVFLGGKR